MSDSIEIDLDAGGMEYSLWCKKLGLSPATGKRWRGSGKVKTDNVEGREFITTREIKRYWTRAKAGEFAKPPRGAAAKAMAKRLSKVRDQSSN